MENQVNENVSQNKEKKEYKPTVNIMLKKEYLREFSSKDGNEFYSARVFNGTKTPDGVDISGYTYTFPKERLDEIKINDNVNDQTRKFLEGMQKNGFGVVRFYEDTNITLTEPYDKENPDKELAKVKIEAKDLRDAQKNREKPAKAEQVQEADRNEMAAAVPVKESAAPEKSEELEK